MTPKPGSFFYPEYATFFNTIIGYVGITGLRKQYYAMIHDM